MKINLSSRVMSALAVVGISVSSTCPLDAALTLNLDQVISGPAPASVTTPWLQATFVNAGENQVKLTMSALNLSGTEFVTKWGFNVWFDPAILKASYVTHSGFQIAQNNPVKIETENLGALNGLSFDFGYDFPPPPGNDPYKFGAGDSITFLLTRTDNGVLNEMSFFKATPSGYTSAAHIQGMIGGASSKIAAVVPEPTTVIAGGLLLLPFGLSAIRSLRRNSH